MQVARVVAGLCVLSGISLAEPATWSRTYTRDASGGDWVCPDAPQEVVVRKGKFGIPWNVKFNDTKRVPVGMITGTVRDSGLVADLKTEVKTGLPKELTDEQKLLDRIVETMSVSFEQIEDRQSISLNAGNCYARWIATVDADEPTVSHFEDDKISQPPADERLPAPKALAGTGAAKWNGAYNFRHGGGGEWQCLHESAVKDFKVAKGKFSLPWVVGTYNRNGRSSPPLQIGQLDGIVDAKGVVKLRASLMVNAVPGELGGNQTLDELQQAAPTITFVSDAGKDNPRGQGRRIEIKYGKTCDIELAAADYKVQAAREEDGWRVDCNSVSAWDKSSSYETGDEVLVTEKSVKRMYRCSSSGCKGKPGASSSSWERVGRCGKR